MLISSKFEDCAPYFSERLHEQLRKLLEAGCFVCFFNEEDCLGLGDEKVEQLGHLSLEESKEVIGRLHNGEKVVAVLRLATELESGYIPNYFCARYVCSRRKK